MKSNETCSNQSANDCSPITWPEAVTLKPKTVRVYTEEQRLRRKNASRRHYLLHKEEINAKAKAKWLALNPEQKALKWQRRKTIPEQIARRREDVRKYYHTHRATRIAYATQRNKTLRKQVQTALNEIKLKSGCVDCGYNKHPVALDFDHISGQKIKPISRFLNLQSALKEAEKCVVRCSNCHRIMTYNRGHNSCQI